MMMPVDVLSVSPAGNVGETAYETTAPPLLDGVLFVIAAPLM
jgi:hypothetical protein